MRICATRKEVKDMTGLNKVIIIGNLGQDPEVRYTKSGAAVCHIRVAVGDRKKEGDQWVDHTEWINCVLFGKQAETAGQYLAKGRQLYVEGKFQTRKYKGKDGSDKYSTEVVVNNFIFLSGDGRKSQGKPKRKQQEQDETFYDDDLAF